MDSKMGGHIYLLELKEAGLAPRSFVSNKKNKHILIRMDNNNRVAIAYVMPKVAQDQRLSTKKHSRYGVGVSNGISLFKQSMYLGY